MSFARSSNKINQQQNRFQLDPAQIEADSKDVLISQLKADLYELKQNEKDFRNLSGELNNLEHRYTLLKEEKTRIEREFKGRNELNQKQISNLRHEIDAMKAELSNINIENQEIRADNSALSDLAEQRGYDINKTRAEISELQEKLSIIKEEVNNINSNVEKSDKDKQQFQQDYDGYCVQADHLLKKQRQLEIQLQDIQLSNQQNSQEVKIVSENKAQLEYQQQVKTEQVKQNEQLLMDLNRQQTVIELEIDKVNNQIEQIRQNIFENKKLSKEIQFKNQELDNQIQETNSNILDKDNEILNVKKILENYQNQNLDYKEDNKILNNDVQLHLQVIRDLENINSELKDELANYLNEDDKVKRMLERQNKVQQAVDLSMSKLNDLRKNINVLN